jgi:DNA-binding NarL/FixJ family response regulator
MSLSVGDVSCVIADDHPILLHAMQSVLEDHGIRVTGTATSGETAIDVIGSIEPTVALVDLRLDGRNGIQVVRAVRRAGLATRVLLFTGYGNGHHLAEAMAAGADGFIQKDAPVSELLRAIEMICSGSRYVDPTLGREFIARRSERYPVLSARENTVLRLVADGQTNGGIAQALDVSEDSAQAAIQSVMRKLGATTRSQAVATALRRALIP